MEPEWATRRIMADGADTPLGYVGPVSQSELQLCSVASCQYSGLVYSIQLFCFSMSSAMVSGDGGCGSIPYGTPVQTKAEPHAALSLVTNHATPNAGVPQANADSAQSLLRDVHNESESGRGSGSKKGVFQWRSRSSGGSRTSGSSSGSLHGKHYAKMGLVMDSPTKQTPPPQWPRVESESVDISGGALGDDGGFEVVHLEGEDVQASPPITVNSDPLVGQGEGPTSSPDSGYGNTPDNPGGEEDHLARSLATGGRARSGAINDSGRLRDDSQDGVFRMDPSPGSRPGSHLTTSHTHHDRLSPMPGVSPGAGPAHGTPPTSLQLASMGSLQDSALVSVSSSSTGDSKEMERDRLSNHIQASSQASSRQTRTANTYHGSRRFRGRASSSKQNQFSKSTGTLQGHCRV